MSPPPAGHPAPPGLCSAEWWEVGGPVSPGPQGLSHSCHRESATPQLSSVGPPSAHLLKFPPPQGWRDRSRAPPARGIQDSTGAGGRGEAAGAGRDCHPGGAPWSGPPEAEGTSPSTRHGDTEGGSPHETKDIHQRGRGWESSDGERRGRKGSQKAESRNSGNRPARQQLRPGPGEPFPLQGCCGRALTLSLPCNLSTREITAGSHCSGR